MLKPSRWDDRVGTEGDDYRSWVGLNCRWFSYTDTGYTAILNCVLCQTPPYPTPPTALSDWGRILLYQPAEQILIILTFSCNDLIVSDIISIVSSNPSILCSEPSLISWARAFSLTSCCFSTAAACSLSSVYEYWLSIADLLLLLLDVMTSCVIDWKSPELSQSVIKGKQLSQYVNKRDNFNYMSSQPREKTLTEQHAHAHASLI